MAELLNNEDYLEILKARFQRQDIEVISGELETFSENIEGFMGDHYNLKIKYKLDDKEKHQTFFVKTKPNISKPYQRETASHIYIKEIYLYENLLNELDKFGFSTEFAPKCYYIKDEDIIVLDNLLECGFKVFPRNHFFDIDHCKAALKSLASYHGNTIAYEEQKSFKLRKTFRFDEENPEAFKATLFRPKDQNSNKFIESGTQCCIHISKLLDEPEDWKLNFENKLKEVDCTKIFNEILPYRTCCCHGDLWSNNMLFKYENDKPVLCKLVDFQLIRHFHPAYDVLLLLYSNTRREFRKDHLEELIDYYYDTLKSVLKGHGLVPSMILMKGDFLKTVQHFQPVALIQAACTRTITMLPTDFTNSSVDSAEGFETLMFKDKRADFVGIAYEKDELFRSVIVDDIYNLDEVL